jgi:hypothetical protein
MSFCQKQLGPKTMFDMPGHFDKCQLFEKYIFKLCVWVNQLSIDPRCLSTNWLLTNCLSAGSTDCLPIDCQLELQSIYQLQVNQLYVGQLLVNKQPVDQLSVDQLSIDRLNVNQMSVNTTIWRNSCLLTQLTVDPTVCWPNCLLTQPSLDTVNQNTCNNKRYTFRWTCCLPQETDCQCWNWM